jgi:hypothetical protein
MKLPMVVAALAMLAAGAAHAERRVALIIGNGAYAHVAKLPNTTRDAEAMEATFHAAGFDLVEAKRDLDSASMRRALRDFSDQVRDADIAAVYYAGHGIEVGGVNYLVPVDATLERDIDVEDEAVPLDRIIRILEQAKRLRLVILDACRENPFARSMKRSLASRGIGRGLAKVDDLSSDTLIAFAAKAGSTAADGEGANSPYTSALVKHIATPGLDLRLALGRVRDDVLKTTHNKQEPFVYGSLGGAEIPLVPEAPRGLANVQPPPGGPAPACTPQRVAASLLRVSKDAGGEIYLDVLEVGDVACITRTQSLDGHDWAFIASVDSGGRRRPVDGWSQLAELRGEVPRRAAPPDAAATGPTSRGGAASEAGGPVRSAAPAAAVPPVLQPPPSAAVPEDLLSFTQPVPFGPLPVNGRSIQELAGDQSIPLFGPIEGLEEALWKKPCTQCHNWDSARLCEQGKTYVKSARDILRHPHPFGGAYKIALMRWAKGGCK